MSTTLAHVPQKQAHAALQRAANLAKKNKDKASRGLRTAASAAAGYAIGHFEQTGALPVAVLGGKVPTKAALALGLTALEMFSTGKTKQAAGAAADLAWGLYAYAAGKTGSFVAGS